MADVVAAAGITSNLTAVMEMATAADAVADVAAGMGAVNNNSSMPLLRSRRGSNSRRLPGTPGLVSECRHRRRAFTLLVGIAKGPAGRDMARARARAAIAMIATHPDNLSNKEVIREATRAAIRVAIKGVVIKATRARGSNTPRARTGAMAEGTAAAVAVTGIIAAVLGSIGSDVLSCKGVVIL